jgi:hypothetical protein
VNLGRIRWQHQDVHTRSNAVTRRLAERRPGKTQNQHSYKQQFQLLHSLFSLNLLNNDILPTARREQPAAKTTIPARIPWQKKLLLLITGRTVP